ncbi:MAG: DUF6734 family protein [Flavobacteriales bacterium]
MRIIQTFWSGNKDTILDASYGWYNSMYHIMGWVLSSNLLSKLYNELELYTDKKGYELLITELKLPYTKVHVLLDDLNTYDSNLWALSKLHVYSLQKKPFLHVDGDVFIWEKFDKNLLQSKLIVQNLERGTDYYKNKWIKLKEDFVFIPEEILEEESKSENMYAYNFGIFGGSDLKFIEKYTNLSFKFVKENIKNISKEKYLDFNVFFEQYLFFCLSNKKKKKVSSFLNKTYNDNEYLGFGDFKKVPKKKYLHLIGHYKRDLDVCKQMARQLLIEFPSEYLNILKIFSLNEYNAFATLFSVNKNPTSYKRYSDFYGSLSLQIKFLKTKQILIKQYLYTSEDINTVFISKKNIENELIELKNEELNNVFKYEEKIQEFLQSLTHLDYLKNINDDYQNFKEYPVSISNLKKSSIIKAKDYLIIKSKYMLCDGEHNSYSEDLNEKQARVIIPSSIYPYYDEVIFDDLDNFIFNEVSNSTYNNLINKIKKYFDSEDIKDNYKGFLKLINGRIENLLYKRILK